jgi:parallel beta-helix repeat protein
LVLSFLVFSISLVQRPEAYSKTSSSLASSVIRVPEDYQTIQEAVNAASVGDTILVAPGTYHENIILNKSILLIGESKENTIIIGSGNGDVIHISSSKVKVSYFTIKNSGNNLGDAGIELNGSTNSSISGCNLMNNHCGIFLNSSDHNMLINNTSHSNKGSGIFLWLSDNNTLEKNTCYSNEGHGIFLWLSDGNTLTNNTCNLNESPFRVSKWPERIVPSGIALWGSSNNVLINNICDLNADHGIKLIGLSQSIDRMIIKIKASSNNILVNNTCSNNEHAGIWLTISHNNILNNNTCNSNNEPGIFLWKNSNNNMLISNKCKFNTDWGIALRSSNNNMVVNNTSSSNDHGIDLKSSVGNTLIGNTFNSNDIGITFENSSYNKVFNNTISANKIGVGIGVVEVEGVRFGDFISNKINRNDIYKNAEFGVLNKAPVEVDATLNWWGDPSGAYHPTLNPSGKGDEVSDNVLFKPWLDAPIGMRAPAFKVSDLLISPTEVEVGETVSISVNVINAGDISGTFTIILKVNGSVEATRDVTLAGGESVVVTFELSKDAPGTYEIEVDGLRGTFSVKEMPPPPWELYATIAAVAIVAIGIAIITYRKKRTPPMRESRIKRFEVQEGYITHYDSVKFIAETVLGFM